MQWGTAYHFQDSVISNCEPGSLPLGPGYFEYFLILLSWRDSVLTGGSGDGF